MQIVIQIQLLLRFPRVVVSYKELWIEYPIEISSEIMIETTEYGLLTEYTKSYYHISSKEAWIVLQQNQEILSVHALTYVYKSLGSGKWMNE